MLRKHSLWVQRLITRPFLMIKNRRQWWCCRPPVRFIILAVELFINADIYTLLGSALFWNDEWKWSSGFWVFTVPCARMLLLCGWRKWWCRVEKVTCVNVCRHATRAKVVRLWMTQKHRYSQQFLSYLFPPLTSDSLIHYIVAPRACLNWPSQSTRPSLWNRGLHNRGAQSFLSCLHFNKFEWKSNECALVL